MFLFASDIHLSLVTWQRLPEVNDSLLSFQQLLSICANKSCPLVLGGDIFDSVRMTPELLEKVLIIRDQYDIVPIYYINGNHDLIEPSWCSFFNNAYHLGAQPTTLPGGEVVCGIDFKLSEEFPDAVSKVYPGCDVLVIHQTLDKLSNNVPGAIDSSVLRNFNCVLAGDYHVPGSYDNLYSAGSTNRRSISEPEGCAYMVQDNGETLQKYFLDYRPLVTVRATDNYDVARQLLAEKLQINIYSTEKIYVQLQKGIVVVRGEITKEVKDYWNTFDPDIAYILFVPDVKETENITVDNAGLVAARSSRYYLLSMLEKYPCSEEAKVIIRDYLAHPDMCIEHIKGKLNGRS